MENIQEEAILGMLSEINKKIDVVVSDLKTSRNIQTPVEIVNPSITKEEVDAISKNYAQQLVNIIGKKHRENLEKLDCFPREFNKLQELVGNIPKQKNISLEPLIKLFPKQKKIAFFGFEFLRTSIVIFALALLSFCLFTVNIRQMDKYRKLEDLCVKQSEYIQQIQKTEKQDNSKVITKKSK